MRAEWVQVAMWCGLVLFFLGGFVGIPLGFYLARGGGPSAPAPAKRQTTGVVETVSCDFDTWLGERKDGRGHWVVLLKAERGVTATCVFDPGAPLPAIKEGDRVTIRGVVEGETFETLHLSSCEVVSRSAHP